MRTYLEKGEFEDMKGFSPRNLRYMRDFANAYPYFPILQGSPAKTMKSAPLEDDDQILQAPLAKLSWYHHITLLDKVKDVESRLFYILATIENGWSRDTMVHQIEGGLHKRQGQLTHNFKETISEQSELIEQVFKDPYKLEFIFLGKPAKERDLEAALTSQMTKFLLELGQHFSYLGKQYRVVLGENEYFYDLLFYHTKLKRYIIIELKIGEFKPEYISKMEFYLKLADEQLKDNKDEKSIGLILCKTKDGLVAEYALRDTQKPIGISEYKLNENLPENIIGELPSIEKIEQIIEEELKELKSPAEKRMETLIQKLASLNKQELKASATYEILYKLYDTSIGPLFICLLDRLKEFDPYFVSSHYYWSWLNKNAKSLLDFQLQWKDLNNLKEHLEPSFFYVFNGLKAAGVEAFNISIQLSVRIDTFWYGFKLTNYNNNQPFLKKLYDQQVTEEDVKKVCDIVAEQIINNIEWQIDHISREKS